MENEMTHQDFSAVRAFKIGRRVAAAIAAASEMLGAVHRDMKIGRAERALEAMPDAMLQDIGIER